MSLLEKFDKYSKRMVRESLPLDECIKKTYDFFSNQKGKYFTLDEIANEIDLKRSEILEGISILREEYGFQISERTFSISEHSGQVIISEYGME